MCLPCSTLMSCLPLLLSPMVDLGPPKETNIIPKNALSFFSSLCQWHSLIFVHRCVIFHVSCLHTPWHLFNIGYFSGMWSSSSCSVQTYQAGPWICDIRLMDLVSEPDLAAFWSYNCLAVFIYLFILARLMLGLEIDRLPVQASPETLCSTRENEKGTLSAFVWLLVNLGKDPDKTEKMTGK